MWLRRSPASSLVHGSFLFSCHHRCRCTVGPAMTRSTPMGGWIGSFMEINWTPTRMAVLKRSKTSRPNAPRDFICLRTKYTRPIPYASYPALLLPLPLLSLCAIIPRQAAAPRRAHHPISKCTSANITVSICTTTTRARHTK